MYIIVRLRNLDINANLDMKNFPTVIHRNFVDAKVEAERLASMNPGSHFGIFQCTEAVCTTVTPPNWVKL
jgi:hypothetical protein